MLSGSTTRAWAIGILWLFIVIETTNELDPLKGLTRLLTLVEVMRKGEENH